MPLPGSRKRPRGAARGALRARRCGAPDLRAGSVEDPWLAVGPLLGPRRDRSVASRAIAATGVDGLGTPDAPHSTPPGRRRGRRQGFATPCAAPSKAGGGPGVDERAAGAEDTLATGSDDAATIASERTRPDDAATIASERTRPDVGASARYRSPAPA